ncbi:hypothetical protein CC80DRAFT_563147 [Byssothecium circinans]|uniref:Uncharacterized protein n=1 Tax=Byssothecium circinans TaxID=147558 RepID=A0A6A5TWE0_9PLEO|nr:hypothetical protein CC80DRAFT_563147 [Byssothecium circinans]
MAYGKQNSATKKAEPNPGTYEDCRDDMGGPQDPNRRNERDPPPGGGGFGGAPSQGGFSGYGGVGGYTYGQQTYQQSSGYQTQGHNQQTQSLVADMGKLGISDKNSNTSKQPSEPYKFKDKKKDALSFMKPKKWGEKDRPESRKPEPDHRPLNPAVTPFIPSRRDAPTLFKSSFKLKPTAKPFIPNKSQHKPPTGIAPGAPMARSSSSGEPKPTGRAPLSPRSKNLPGKTVTPVGKPPPRVNSTPQSATASKTVTGRTDNTVGKAPSRTSSMPTTKESKKKVKRR